MAPKRATPTETTPSKRQRTLSEVTPSPVAAPPASELVQKPAPCAADQGWPDPQDWPRTIGVLRRDLPESISRARLPEILAAVFADAPSVVLRGFSPSGGSLAPRAAGTRGACSSPTASVLDVDCQLFDQAEHFRAPLPLAAGDILMGTVKEKECRLRLRAGTNEGQLSADVFFKHGNGSWKTTDDCRAALLTFERMLGQAATLRWRVQLAGLDASECAGILQGSQLEGKDGCFNLAVVRTRADAMPGLKWVPAAEKVDEYWVPCRQVLEHVHKMGPLQASIGRFPEWRQELEHLQQRWEKVKEDPAVLFIGASGCGKSRLINEMLGAEVLPCAGEGVAVTAAPIEVRFRKPSPRSPTPSSLPPGEAWLYDVRFELFSQDEFVEMRDQMSRELLEYWEITQDEGVLTIPARKPPQEDHAKAARSAHDWFEAVYGRRALKKPWASADEFKAAFNDKFPPLIKPEPVVKEEKAKLPNELLQKLKEWLVAKVDKQETGQRWPLVKWATVRGPWECLRAGLSFVDLPGFGDSNGVRDRIVNREYRRADFVCICSRFDRAATDRASLDWLAKAVRDLPPGNIAYVATKADDINRDEVVRDNKLPPTTTQAEAAQVRNEKVKKQVRKKYEVKVYTTSAQDYARCVGRDLKVPQTFLQAEATEVPRLTVDVIDTVLKRKVLGRIEIINSLHTQLQFMESQLRECPGADIDAAHLQKAFALLVAQVKNKMQASSQKFQQNLSRMRQRFTTDVSEAANEGRQSLRSQAAHFGIKTDVRHHARYKALIVRDGCYDGYDIAESVGRPMVGSLDKHWINLFHAFPVVAGELLEEVQASVEKLNGDFAVKLSNSPGLKELAQSRGRATANQLRSKLKEVLGAFDESLQELRSGYDDEITDNLRAQVGIHLREAKMESGIGSFARRKESVTNSLPRVNFAYPETIPSKRVASVDECFRRTSAKMFVAATSLVDSCYADFWQKQLDTSEHERRTKKTLREGLEPKVEETLAALENCKSTMPASVASA